MHSNLGDNHQATEDLSRAIRLDSEDAESYFQRRRSRIELGRHPEAVDDLDQAVSLDPQHPFADSDRRAAAELAGCNGTV